MNSLYSQLVKYKSACIVSGLNDVLKSVIVGDQKETVVQSCMKCLEFPGCPAPSSKVSDSDANGPAPNRVEQCVHRRLAYEVVVEFIFAARVSGSKIAAARP